MTITTTDLGHNSVALGASVSITTGVAVPAGSLIVVAVWENASDIGQTTTNSVTDNGGNTYTKIVDKVAGGVGGVLGIWYCKNASLVSGKVITYTPHDTNNGFAISAFYATGIDTTAPLDTAVTASANAGSGASPSVISGTPAASGELFAAAVGWANSSAPSFTQDTGHGWASPFSADTAHSNSSVAGGSQVNAGTGTKTFSPTVGGAGATQGSAAIIVGFKAAATATTFNQTVSATCASAVSRIKSVGKKLAISSISSTIVSAHKVFGKIVSVVCTSAVSILRGRGFTKIVTVACTSATTFKRGTAKIVTVACTSTSTFKRAVAKKVTATCTSATTIRKSIAKKVTATCTSATIVGRGFAKIVTVACTSSVAWFKAVGKAVAVSALTAVTFKKAISKSVSAALSSMVDYVAAFIQRPRIKRVLIALGAYSATASLTSYRGEATTGVASATASLTSYRGEATTGAASMQADLDAAD